MCLHVERCRIGVDTVHLEIEHRFNDAFCRVSDFNTMAPDFIRTDEPGLPDVRPYRNNPHDRAGFAIMNNGNPDPGRIQKRFFVISGPARLFDFAQIVGAHRANNVTDMVVFSTNNHLRDSREILVIERDRVKFEFLVV